MMNYWASLQGYKEEHHPAVRSLNPCWESGKAKVDYCAWTTCAREMGIQEKRCAAVSYSLYTDGSNDLNSGKTGFAYVVPELNSNYEAKNI